MKCRCKKAMEHIGLYTQLTEFTTEHAGTAEWCKAEKNGKQFFVKKFHSPVYPSKEIGLPEKMYNAGVEEFHEALTFKRDIYDRLRKCNQSGLLVVPIEVINYQFHICTIADFVTGNVSPNQVCLLSEWQRLVLIRTLTLALMNTHAAGVVHSDMKPDNVLITQDQNGHCRLRLIDFDGSFIESNPPTDPEDVVGDPTYFSPEAYSLSMDESILLDHRIDIFALGIIFHYYWCGRLPKKPDDQTIGECILRGGSVDLDASIPPVIRQLIIRMISADPDARISLKQVYDVLGIQVDQYPPTIVNLQPARGGSDDNNNDGAGGKAELRINCCTESGEILKYRTLLIPYGTKKVIEAEEIRGYHLIGLKTKEVSVDSKGAISSPIIFSYRKDDEQKNWIKVLATVAALFVLYWIIMYLLSMSAFSDGEWSKAIQYMDYTPLFAEMFKDTYQDARLHLTESTVSTARIGNNQISIIPSRISRIRFTAPSSGIYIFKSTETDDTVGYLYNSATTTTVLAENDDYNNNQFQIEYSMNANQSVYVGVKYYDSSRSGTVNLNISRKANPTATPSPTPQVSTVGTGTSRISVAEGRTARVRFVAPSRGTYVFTSTGTDDTVGYLFNTTTTSSALASDDDSGGNNQFRIEYSMNANQSVYVGVKYHNSSRSGTVNLNISRKANPTATPSPTPQVSTVGTGTSRISVAAGHTVRVKFVAPSRETYVFTSTGTVDTVGYLFSSATTSTALASDDDSGGNNQFRIEYLMNANQSIYVGVKYYDSSQSGTIAINISKASGSINTNRQWPVGSTCTVNVGNGRARTGPGDEHAGYAIAGYVSAGDQFNILDFQLGSTGKDWYKINLNGSVCWISSGIVIVDGHSNGTVNGVPIN